jgi:hypothetical protein
LSPNGDEQYLVRESNQTVAVLRRFLSAVQRQRHRILPHVLVHATERVGRCAVRRGG